MASEKPTMILLSKSDMGKDEISNLSDAEAWKLIYSLRTARAKDTRLQVCFTGFGVSKKQELIDIAGKNNIKVVSSVTKKLDFLCGGENAGPKKIEKAESQGVQFLTEDQFIQLIETGEIPHST
jgi:NAD-dependent DNA ligase